VLALPESWRRRVPGLAALQDVLRLASPGRWLPALRRVLLPAQREALDGAIGLARRHQRLYGDVQKWALLVASQLFAVSFHAAALAIAMLLVVFSDLAFGWSTTLTSESHRVHHIVAALAAPWARIWPDAVPPFALVEQTQYFRGAADSPPGTALGAWWRFCSRAWRAMGSRRARCSLRSQAGASAWRCRVCSSGCRARQTCATGSFERDRTRGCGR
jgi:hypothetical protein